MSPDITEALSVLKEFSFLDPNTAINEDAKTKLRSAINTIVPLSSAQNLGICCGNSQEALDTLSQYLNALGYQFDVNSTATNHSDSPSYLKFSTQRMAYNLSSYEGEYRGVLITIFAPGNQDLEGTFGHFPLDLFAS